MPKTKKGHFRGIFGDNTPFFLSENCVFDIALVSLVGVGTYEKILRPTQNPTLVGMDTLYLYSTSPSSKNEVSGGMRKMIYLHCSSHSEIVVGLVTTAIKRGLTTFNLKTINLRFNENNKNKQ